MTINSKRHSLCKFSVWTQIIFQSLTCTRRLNYVKISLSEVCDEIIRTNILYLTEIISQRSSIRSVLVRISQVTRSSSLMYRLLVDIISILSKSAHISTLELNCTIVNDTNDLLLLPVGNSIRHLIHKSLNKDQTSCILTNLKNFNDLISLSLDGPIGGINFCELIQTSHSLTTLRLQFDSNCWEHANVDVLEKSFAVNRSITHVIIDFDCKYEQKKTSNSLIGHTFFEIIGYLPMLHTLIIKIPFWKMEGLFNPLTLLSFFTSRMNKSTVNSFLQSPHIRSTNSHHQAMNFSSTTLDKNSFIQQPLRLIKIADTKNNNSITIDSNFTTFITRDINIHGT
jgi:hypothetical protein